MSAKAPESSRVFCSGKGAPAGTQPRAIGSHGTSRVAARDECGRLPWVAYSLCRFDPLRRSADQRLDELGGHERPEIVEAFADADESERNGMLLLA